MIQPQVILMGFPGGTSGKEPTCQCRRQKRCGIYPWVRKIPWRRAWQATAVFLPEESPWTTEELVGYIVHSVTELDTTEET